MTAGLRHGRGSLISGALDLVRARSRTPDPLQRSALALAANSALTAALGFVYWIVAARLYSPAAVGESAALISALLLLANIAEVNLYNGLIRFLPAAGPRTMQYVRRAYVTVIVMSVVVGIAALPLLQGVSLVRYLVGRGTSGVALFLLAVLAWTLFALQDGVAIGARAAVWVLVENVSFGVAKLGLLVVFAMSANRLGIFSSWLLSIVLVLVPMTVLLFRRLLPRHAEESLTGSEQISRRNVLAFVTVDNLTLLSATAATYLLPVIVATRVGNEANGFFFVAWAVGGALDVALVNAASSLTVEGARQRQRLGALVGVLLRRVVMLTVPIVLVVLLTAPVVLSLYGSAYAVRSTDLLRVVAVAVLPRIVVVIWMSVQRVHQQLGRILLVQVILATVVLAASYLLVPRYGIVAVGLAHLFVQTSMAVVLAPSLLRVVGARPRR